MEHEILPPSLAIKSMRSSGYKDAAYALAELIDNSAQAGLQIEEKTHIELICLDKIYSGGARRRPRIDQVAVYDNACGMDKDLLRRALQFGNGTNLTPSKQTSIGKFGMGLPNASISQCKKVDVWSWKEGICHYCYLDLDEIENGEMRDVPEPEASTIPEKWRSLIKNPIGDHGTLVVWSKIDRIRWKTSEALLRNSEHLIGRIYRYFLADGRVSIRLAAYQDDGGKLHKKLEAFTRPNDPLFLMKGTSDPVPYNKKPAFTMVTEYDIPVEVGNEKHLVHFKFSVCSKEVRHQGGNSSIGKYASRNQGVSVVRAERELELNSSFVNTYDPTERWWGVEVSFEPALDDIFGVTNNKQAATAFKLMNIQEDAKKEGLKLGEYKEVLDADDDPRIIMYKVSHEISRVLGTKDTPGSLRKLIKTLGEGKKEKGNAASQPGSSEHAATEATKKRKKEQGKTGESDRNENLSPDEKIEQLAKDYEKMGKEPEEARQIAVDHVNSHMKFIFEEGDIPGAYMFDVRIKADKIIVILNENHPARDGLFEVLKGEDGEVDAPALKSLKLLLEAWARMEDEASGSQRQILEDIRSDWGRMARDFLQAANQM